MAKKNTDDTILDVQQAYSKGEEFVEKNNKLIIGALAVIVLGVLAYVLYTNQVKEPAMVEANERLALAEAYWLRGDSLSMAIEGSGDFEGIREIADEYGSSSVGRRANYIVGIYERDQKNFEEAVTRFKTAAFSSPILGAFANGNIGDCLVEQGAAIEATYTDAEVLDAEVVSLYEEALPYFVKAAESSVDEMTTMVYYKKAATVCLKLGKYGQAERMYDGIIASSSSATSADYKDAQRMKAMCAAKQMAN